MRWRIEVLVQSVYGMLNWLITILGPGAFQLFWYLLPFIALGLIAFVIHKRKLKWEYYWLAYGAFLLVVIRITIYLAADARDTIRVWLEVLWVFHAPVLIPTTMIAPALLLMAFLHSLGYGPLRCKRVTIVKEENSETQNLYYRGGTFGFTCSK